MSQDAGNSPTSKGINDLVSLIERNRAAREKADWYNSNVPQAKADEEPEEEAVKEEPTEDDFEDVQLLIFAAEGPWTQSIEPLLDPHDITYAIVDTPEQAVDIVMNNMKIQHVIIDLDRPTNPSMGMNVFSELKMINPHMKIFYCTKNPMSMESRNIQTKGGTLIQKPVLRKTIDQFIMDNFRN